LYVLLQLPVRPWYANLFPKAWLLVALLFYTGWRLFRSLHAGPALTAAVLVMLFSSVDAWRRWISYRSEPPSVAAHPVVDPGAIFSSAPTVAGYEIAYQAIAQERYVVRSSTAGRIQTFAFEGHALRPTIGGDSIYFELVNSGHSRIGAFDRRRQELNMLTDSNTDGIDPAASSDGTRIAFVAGGSLLIQESGARSLIYKSTFVSGPAFFPDGRRVVFAEGPPGKRSIRVVTLGGEPQTIVAGRDTYQPAVSPDGLRIAYTASETGGTEVWVRDLAAGVDRRVTSGACNNDSPAWRADSRHIVFASDCSRGVGLPALYEILAQ